MDKVGKALARLGKPERSAIRAILLKLQANNPIGLDIKKLVGHQDIFRVRKGSLRVIFRRDSQGKVFVLAIERRSESTYRRW
jgi:mRNA-degrading endonuclease RelE of RelBE toxin-antitoxin system